MDQINFDQSQMGESDQKLDQKEIEKQNILEARRMSLRAILTVEAQERLNRISSVKPEKATLIENFLLQKYGYSTTKITDQQLKQLIEAISKSQANTSTIRIQRKRWDDDDDL